jgi:uncharacterized protein (DUF1330 family)
MKWTDTSRHKSLREYKISKDNTKLMVKCHDVSSYSYYFTEKEISSVDPVGGPYLAVGKVVKNIHNQKWMIERIISHKKRGDTVIFVFDIVYVE